MTKTSRAFLTSLCFLCFLIAAIPALAAPEAPWLVGRTTPPWADVKPRRTLQVAHDANRSDEANGVVLARAVSGDRHRHILTHVDLPGAA